MKLHKQILLILAWFLCNGNVFATHVAVLETFADESLKESISYSDKIYLTNVFREEAIKVLAAEQNYTIMTRENINAMLPPGKSIEECEGSCLTETGRNISADYICQARIGSFDGALTLSAELYETAGNKLMASFNGEGANLNDLLSIIKQKSPEFFQKIKGGGTFYAEAGIIENINSASGYTYTAKKKFIVEIETNPPGAVPTIDGRGIPKCTSTPCKVQVEEGNHRFTASLDRYDDAEKAIDITENNQKVELSLSPNFGWFVVAPVYAGKIQSKDRLNITIDGKPREKNKFILKPGIHSVRITHPCFDPMEFNVAIEKNKTVTFDKVMTRGKGGLELDAVYKGNSQAITVLIDGKESGSTPFAGEIPLCSEITLKGNGWTEKVNVTPRYHDVVHAVHYLKHEPDVAAITKNDAIRQRAQAAYDELDGKKTNNASAPISNPKNPNSSSNLKLIPLAISATAMVTGVVLAVAGNAKAKNAAEKGGDSEKSFKRNINDAETGQTMRGIGIGIAIVGAIGVGISFAF